MDQDAFRSLLASRPAASSSQSSSKHVLGKAAPKRSAWGLKASAKTEKLLAEKAKDTEEAESKPDFVPRQQRRVPVKENGERYLDRAAMRREGKEDEYTEVARTLEDFERRQKEAGADDRQIAETRKHLGGDAEHSVLVKGLDFSLLAARKAELEREKEDLADEELDALLGGQKKVEKVEEKKVVQEEKIGKGFKSIGKKAEEPVGGEVKKKKKKKKVKSDPAVSVVKQERVPKEDQAKMAQASVVPLPPSVPAKVKEEVPAPPPPEPEDEEDIFADVGGYNLNAGEEDSGSEDDHKADLAESSKRPQRRASSRSPSLRTRSEEGRVPSRSRSREDRRARYRSDSRDRGRDRHHDSYRRRDDSRDLRRDKERSDSRERDGRYDRYSHNDRHYAHHNRHDRYDSHDRSGSPSRIDRRDRYDHYDDRHKSRDWSRSPRRDEGQYDRQSKDEQRPYRRSPSPRRRYSPAYSRSPSPPARRRSPSPTPPPAKRPRQRTRTPSPTMFQHHISSPESSDSEDEGPLLPGGKLQPLASSAMGDIKGFLAADADATKADEKRLRKAQWRARQGLAPQEGVDVATLEKKLGDKQRANREYQLVMNQVNKAQKDDEGAGGAADE